MSNHNLVLDVKSDFQTASPSPASDKKPTPFSLRLTVEERTYLERKAGNRPLSVYIREILLGDQCSKRRAQRKPKVNQKELAGVLAALGQSRMSANLNQIAKAANSGSIKVPEDTQQQLEDAYQAIIAMREALYIALGMRS